MSKLIRSSGIFAILTLLSRILGLVRDVVIAKYFTVIQTDVFFVALRIPNTFRRFFAEGSFANAFIPVLADYKENESELKFKNLIDSVFTVLGIVLLLVTMLGILFSGFIVSLGFGDKTAQIELTSLMLKITFPYIFFISLTAFFAGILNVHQRFALPAFLPALLNISIITAVLFFRNYFDEPVIVLGVAVFVGGILQFLIQIPVLWRLKCLPKLKFNHLSKGVKKILILMGPTILGSSVGQINILLNTFLATLLVSGSVTWLYYSERLVELPVAIIGVALGTVILPKLSILKEKNDHEFRKTLIWAIKIAFLLGSAAATGLFILAYPLIVVLFQRGAFDAHSAYMASLSLQVFAVSAFALLMIKVLAPAFYARQDTKTPVKIGIFCIAINMVVSLSLFRLFGHVGLAIASTTASVFNMSLLFFFIYQKDWVRLNQSFIYFILKVIAANLIMFVIIMIAKSFLLNQLGWVDLSTLKRIIFLFSLIAIGIFSYVISLVMLKLNPYKLLQP